MQSFENYYCCFSSESCPSVKIIHPRCCQWSIRTQTGWSCRGHLSVGPIYASFNVPGILDKMSMFRKSKSKMMFLSESICSSLSGPDLSHNSNITAICYNSEGIMYTKVSMLDFWPKCNVPMKPRRISKVTELMVDSSSAPFSWLFVGLKREIWLCLDVNTDV